MLSLWLQVQTSTKWSELSIKLRRKSIEDVPRELEDEFMQSFSPGFILMPLEVADRKVCCSDFVVDVLYHFLPLEGYCDLNLTVIMIGHVKNLKIGLDATTLLRKICCAPSNTGVETS